MRNGAVAEGTGSNAGMASWEVFGIIAEYPATCRRRDTSRVTTEYYGVMLWFYPVWQRLVFPDLQERSLNRIIPLTLGNGHPSSRAQLNCYP